jgi:Flp pilus assembly protein CpaB
MNQYRSSVDDSSELVGILIAKSLIPKGMSGDLIGSQELFQPSTAPKGQVKDGALSDPASLRGRVALDDIYPGQQLTTADFSSTTTDAVASKITADQRAVAVPLDEAHGLIGHVRAGDRVDIFGGFNVVRVDRRGVPISSSGAARPVLKLLMENVYVLAVPADAGGGFGGGAGKEANVILRLTDEQAAQLAFASDNGKVWFSLRPQSGASPSTPSFVTLETLLLGVRPVTVLRSFGGRP